MVNWGIAKGMVDSMDIAALSMNMSSVSVNARAQASILKMAMDIPAQAVGSLLDNMQGLEEELARIIMSDSGQNIDMYV